MLSRLFRLRAPLLAVAVLLAACRTAAPPPAPTADAGAPVRVTYAVVADTVAEDAEVAALVAPYRAQIADRVAEVVGRAAVPMTEDEPEGLLGNFAADALLAEARARAEGPVDVAITNNGGLRVPIAAGPITVGRLFELMPFENRVVVLSLSGVQMDTLAQQLARIGGEPLAGMSFKMYRTSRRAFDVAVGGRVLDPAATYRIATSDYLADGGGGMPVLWEAGAREDLDLLLRDAFIEYVRARGVVEPTFDGRIVVVDDEAYMR